MRFFRRKKKFKPDVPQVSKEIFNYDIPDRDLDSKERFCVLSWGGCGSIWIGNILNNHPEIACSAGNDHPAISLAYDDNVQAINAILDQILTQEDIKLGANLAGEGSLSAEINTENYHEYIMPRVSYAAANLIKAELSKKNLNLNLYDRFNLVQNFPDFFKELERFSPNKSFYGNVHGLTCEQIKPLVKQNDEFFKKTVFVDLIRNPITRMESIVNGRRKLYQYNLAERQLIDASILKFKDKSDEISAKYQINFNEDLESKIRFYCSFAFFDKGVMKLWADDIRAVKVKRIIFERIKNEPEYLSWMISYLTNGKVSVSKDFLDQVYNTELFNSGHVGQNKIEWKSARDQWEEWPLWQQEVFRQQCQEYDLYKLYSEFEYDLSFVK